jgi:type I restriction enzyme R subunit
MSTDKNQNPEQIARDKIDFMLKEAGWTVQSKNEVDLGAGRGVALREYQAETKFADYVLFVDKKPVGIIEAKKEDEGHKLTVAEDQAKEYSVAKLKYLDNDLLCLKAQEQLHVLEIHETQSQEEELYFGFTNPKLWRNGYKKTKV